MGLIKTSRYVAPLPIEVMVELAIKALPAWRYQIGLLNRDHQEQSKQMFKRDGDGRWVNENVPMLKHYNANSREILFYPIDPRYVLLDDLTLGAVKRLETEGFAPALTVETSRDNFQAWIKFPDLRGIKGVEQEYSLRLSRHLVQKFGGDRGAVGGMRFGKMPGFRNRKAKHVDPDGRAPMVLLCSASGREAPAGAALAERVKAELLIESETKSAAWVAVRPGGAVAEPVQPSRAAGVPPLGVLEAQYEIALQKAGGDRSRADFAIAAKLAEAGAGEDQIAAIIEKISEKAAERGDYAQRTAAAAIARVRTR